MLERGSSGLRSPSASDSSLAPLFSFVPTWKTTEKTTPIPKTISDRFCNYTQRGTPHHHCYKHAPAALRSPEDTVGGVIKPWDHILGTKNSDFCPTCQPDSFCCGRRASSPLFKKLHSKYHPDAARPPSLYAECKSIIDGFHVVTI